MLKSNTFNIGIVVLTDEWKVVGANSYAKKILKVSNSNLGKDVFFYHSPSSYPKIRYLLNRLSDHKPNLPVTKIIDVLNKVLMINLCEIDMVDEHYGKLFLMSFIDLSKETEAYINPDSGNININKFPIFSKDSIIFLDVHSIYFIKSDGNYCKIITEDDSYYLHLTLKDILHRYSGPELMRIHKSYIVNLTHIKEVLRTNEGKTIIIFDKKNIQHIPVARREINKLKTTLANFLSL